MSTGGTLWDRFINIHSNAKYQKSRRGTLLRHLKIFKKKSPSAEKKERGDPLVSSYFVDYLKIINHKSGQIALSLHWPDLDFVVSGVSLKRGEENMV